MNTAVALAAYHEFAGTHIVEFKRFAKALFAVHGPRDEVVFGERYIFTPAQFASLCVLFVAVCGRIIAHVCSNGFNSFLLIMSSPPPPFSCRYSPQLPELIYQLRCSIAITTYQAGKVIIISAPDEDRLVQLPRTFDKPMGVGYDATRGLLALACRNEVISFANSPQLAEYYPQSPGKYDALFVPRVTYHTGAIDVHDLRFGISKEGDSHQLATLYAVNTRFNCIVTLDHRYNFTPYWMPPQIDKLAGDDRCHLNGMAMVDGLPKYATAFGTSNTPGAWRDTLLDSGVVYDLSTSEIIADGLGMPHSPRMINGELHLLLSATGQLVKLNAASGAVTVVAEIGGFIRGMDQVGDYLFIAQSKLRKNSSTFSKLPFAADAQRAGLQVIHLPTGARVGELVYLASVDEIYDVHVFSGLRRPNILGTDKDVHQLSLMTPTATFWAKKAATE